MQHTCYHILSDQNTNHISSFSELKKLASDWKYKGDSNIRVYKIVATEVGSDEISIQEILLPSDEIFN